MGLSAYGRWRPELYRRLDQGSNKMSHYWKEAVASLRADFELSDTYEHPWRDSLRCDLAFNGQKYWCDRFYEKLETYRFFSDTLALAGGCALNVLLNSRIADSGLYERVHTCPVPNDSGQSIGAILYRHRDIQCEWPFLGRSFGDVDGLPETMVDDLMANRIVAWYQGRAESGPRALCHRSLLGLPNSVAMRDRMNIVKGREPYRPVAPVVAAEELERWFETRHRSPYMSFSPKAKAVTQTLAPAIVHVDGTSRVQTLSREQNPIIHELLMRVKQETEAPILMNSSFNQMGHPMVDTPEDAIEAFEAGNADVLYLNGERIERRIKQR